MPVRIQEQDFDLTTEIANLRSRDGTVGAVAIFVGTVRDLNDGTAVRQMTLEHYPGMTEAALQSIIDQAKVAGIFIKR